MSMPSKPANEPERSETERPAGGGTLYVVATPIGNLSDVTLRALDTLRTVQVIAAEDTRHTRKLLSRYDIHKPLVSYHTHNAVQRGKELLDQIAEGKDIALVSDAGTPGISDPGALLVEEAVGRGLAVVVIPGPTALVAALTASGLPTHPFAFIGFAPNRGAARRRFFASYATLPMTVVLYESPKRLVKTLEDLLEGWGDRRVAVARELTKVHEEIFRGTISEAKAHFAPETKGELTLVVAGAGEQDLPEAEKSDWREDLLRLLEDEGTPVKEAASRIAERFGLARRLVYQEALALRKPSGD